MADNCIRTPGTGETVLADEVTDATLGTGKVQLVKIMDGTLDGTDKCHVDATNGLAVEVKNSSIAGTAGSPNSAVLSIQASAVARTRTSCPPRLGRRASASASPSPPRPPVRQSGRRLPAA